ncbi:MAG: tetratricopeptide repeat protein [Thermoguttaceae bacterium]
MPTPETMVSDISSQAPHASGDAARAGERAKALLVCGLLVLAVALAFGQTIGFGFVNYDDDAGVYENRLVTGPLTWESLKAVLTDRHVEGTVPLTCVSHMLVWHLLGHNAAAHHAVNVLLHAGAVVLLFLTLWRMTDQLWPSALAAFLFAVHPLRVESVAWVTERKDVLSGLLFMLTLAAYSRYGSRPFAIHRYLAVLACFILGLAAKPMLVTLPFVLLLLDWWPLRRTPTQRPGQSPARLTIAMRLILEKLPMFAVAAFFCWFNLHGRTAASLVANRQYSFAWRLGNAIISYVAYLGDFFCPLGLTPCYPRRVELPAWQVAASALLLVAVTALALRWRRQRPYLLVGWLWYLGMLTPVIGLVQFGGQAEADRFTYLPCIGLAIALVWAGADLCRRWPRLLPFGATVAASAVLLLTGAAWRQTSYWRDSETLWSRVLACDSRNALAHNNLGATLLGRGQVNAAMKHYQTALNIDPDYAKAHHNLGVVLAACGRPDEAIESYWRAIRLDPQYAEANNNLGVALAGCERFDEAIERYGRALEIDPDYAVAHNNVGIALVSCGRFAEARRHYRLALQIKPAFVEAMLNLSWLMATCPDGRLRDGRQALDYAERACKLCGGTPEALHCLAAAWAEQRKFPEALAAARRALELAERQRLPSLATFLRAEIASYERGKPWRLDAAAPR